MRQARMASVGVRTKGSSCMLNDVLIKTGVPVFSPKSVSTRCRSGCSDARTAEDERCRRHGPPRTSPERGRRIETDGQEPCCFARFVRTTNQRSTSSSRTTGAKGMNSLR